MAWGIGVEGSGRNSTLQAVGRSTGSMELKHWRHREDCEEPIHPRKRGESSFLASESRNDEVIMGGSPRAENSREDCDEESIRPWKRGESSFLDSFFASKSRNDRTITGGSPRTEHPSFRRNLIVWVFLAVAAALSTLRWAFGSTYFIEDPHLIGDLPRQPSSPLRESDISLEFEAAFAGASGDLQDNPPPVDSWLVKGHHLPDPEVEGQIPKRINKIYFQKDGNFHTEFSLTKRDVFSRIVDMKTHTYEITSPVVGKNSRDISDLIKAAHRSWTDKNPGYKVHYYNLPAARKYLRTFYHPVFLRAFDCIEAFAGKSDLFRMALLFREGGWTSDWKQVCLEDGLLDAIASEMDFFVAADQGHEGVIIDRCAQTSFVGVVPQHKVVESYLKMALLNVQDSVYGFNPLFTTGPCLWGQAVRLHDKDFGDKNYQGPTHADNKYHWNGRDIVQGKCNDCGTGQKWKGGNDYNTLHKSRKYYCEDAASVFKP